jgi:hypothetical protein
VIQCNLHVTYRQATARKFTMSGLKGDHIVYVRAVATCKGIAAAFLWGVAQADLYAQDTLTSDREFVHNLLHALPDGFNG